MAQHELFSLLAVNVKGEISRLQGLHINLTSDSQLQ